jgi:hypothetical protein
MAAMAKENMKNGVAISAISAISAANGAEKWLRNHQNVKMAMEIA